MSDVSIDFEPVSMRDKAVIKALQGDFPLCEEPYKVLAQQAGMTEEEFILFLGKNHIDIFRFDSEDDLLRDIKNA